MKIAMGNDHTGIELKNIIKEFVEGKGYEVIDLGTNASESCDYPVYGEKVGISLACNKVKGIRACVCSEPYTAKLSRQHNNSNVLAFGSRVVGSELAKMITEAWLDAAFEGGRHQRRVDMVMEIEKR